MKVKCVRLSAPGYSGYFEGGCKIEVGGIYDVVGTKIIMNTNYYELAQHRNTVYTSDLFEPYNPYSNSVSKELAEKAMNPVIEIDQPVKELEITN